MCICFFFLLQIEKDHMWHYKNAGAKLAIYPFALWLVMFRFDLLLNRLPLFFPGFTGIWPVAVAV